VKSLRDANESIPTHQIAASMRSADQIVSLAGVDVYTIPPKAVAEFYAQNHRPEDITLKTAENYTVTFNPSTDVAAVELLWTVDDRFLRFAHDLDSMGGETINGDDLRTADKDFKIGLFTNFTAAEKLEIRAKGKIPETARWQGRASLDDLMTESAIQSFTVDQAAFDDHIRKMINA